MKKTLNYILALTGSLSVLLFCVSAAASSIPNSLNVNPLTFSEPLNMLLLGFTLVGFGSVFRRKKPKP